MDYIFQKGKSGKPTFVLLHGTGGDEESLLPLAHFLDSEANVLSLRGDVNEHGMLRFFKRLAEGHYDVNDLNQRGLKLRELLIRLAEQHELELSDMILVGFSNGANIAVNLLLQDQTPLQKAILFSPMYPVDVSHLKEEKQEMKVFLSLGKMAPIVSVVESERVVQIFEERQVEVRTVWGCSHEVSLPILEAAKDWLQNVK